MYLIFIQRNKFKNYRSSSRRGNPAKLTETLATLVSIEQARQRCVNKTVYINYYLQLHKPLMLSILEQKVNLTPVLIARLAAKCEIRELVL